MNNKIEIVTGNKFGKNITWVCGELSATISSFEHDDLDLNNVELICETVDGGESSVYVSVEEVLISAVNEIGSLRQQIAELKGEA